MDARVDTASQAAELRAAIREGRHDGRTTGLMPGVVQANLVILPAAWAGDFRTFCRRNHQACPLIDETAPGTRSLPRLGVDIDVATDLPRYNVFRDGVLVEEATDLTSLWAEDFIAFALGCSYSFEGALLAAGLRLRHQDLGVKVPLYVTNMATAPAGPFEGPLIVSMRPFQPADAIQAIAITSRYDQVHGAPVHFGDPAAIGIADIDTPWSGAPPVLHPGEVPLFWACGVTPQLVLERARPPIAITHKPGHMLVTDLLNAEFARAA